MTEERASEGSAHAQQPGVTPADTGEDVDRVSEDDITLASPDEVSAPPGAPDDSPSTVNAALVDDPEEFARAIREATGESVEVVSEKDMTPES